MRGLEGLASASPPFDLGSRLYACFPPRKLALAARDDADVDVHRRVAVSGLRTPSLIISAWAI